MRRHILQNEADVCSPFGIRYRLCVSAHSNIATIANPQASNMMDNAFLHASSAVASSLSSCAIALQLQFAI